MTRIRPWLYIGSHCEAVDLPLLRHHGIQAVLHLADRVRHPGPECMDLPVRDGEPLDPELLRRGLELVHRAHREGKVLLIACGAGISRSASYVIAAIRETEGCDLWEAFTRLKDLHPSALPHPALWASLCGHYGEAVPYLDVVRYGRRRQE